MTVADADHITGPELASELRAQGADVPESTLRSWREKGLLPTATRGGVARYPLASIEQAVAAHALSLRKKRAKFIGWHLWLQGYEVDDKYWKTVLKEVGNNQFKWLRRIARSLNSGYDNEIDALEMKMMDQANTTSFPRPVSGYTRRMNTVDKAAVLSTIANSVAGTLEDGDEALDRERLGSLQTAIGAASANTDLVQNVGFSFEVALDQIIRALPQATNFKSNASLFTGNRVRLLEEARRDFVFGLQTAIELNEAFSWIFGPNAFGMRAASWFRWNAPIKIQASLILLWVALKESDRMETLSTSEIVENHDTAIRVNALSRELQLIAKDHPHLGGALERHNVRNALKSEEKFEKFLKRIRNEACI